MHKLIIIIFNWSLPHIHLAQGFFFPPNYLKLVQIKVSTSFTATKHFSHIAIPTSYLFHTVISAVHLETPGRAKGTYSTSLHIKYLNLLTRIKESGFKDNVKASPPEMLWDCNRKASKNAGQLKIWRRAPFSYLSWTDKSFNKICLVMCYQS